MTRLTLHRHNKGSEPTDSPHDTHTITVIDQWSGKEVARYARTLHPLYRREGYTIDPPHIKGRDTGMSYYISQRFQERFLDPRLQHKFYIDPDLPLTGDEKSKLPTWHPLDQITADLEPLLSL